MRLTGIEGAGGDISYEQARDLSKRLAREKEEHHLKVLGYIPDQKEVDYSAVIDPRGPQFSKLDQVRVSGQGSRAGGAPWGGGMRRISCARGGGGRRHVERPAANIQLGSPATFPRRRCLGTPSGRGRSG